MRSANGSQAALDRKPCRYWPVACHVPLAFRAEANSSSELRSDSALRTQPRVVMRAVSSQPRLADMGACGVARSAHALSRNWCDRCQARWTSNCGARRTRRSGWQSVVNGNDSNSRTLERPAIAGPYRLPPADARRRWQVGAPCLRSVTPLLRTQPNCSSFEFLGGDPPCSGFESRQDFEPARFSLLGAALCWREACP
jgi:hypothetical protein